MLQEILKSLPQEPLLAALWVILFLVATPGVISVCAVILWQRYHPAPEVVSSAPDENGHVRCVSREEVAELHDLIRSAWSELKDTRATLVSKEDFKSLQARVQQVAQRVHRHSGAVGVVPLLRESIVRLEQRLENHVKEQAEQTEQLTQARVRIGEMSATLRGVKCDVEEVKDLLCRVADRLNVLPTPSPEIKKGA